MTDSHSTSTPTVADLGEFSLVSRILAAIEAGEPDSGDTPDELLIGPGDDAAVRRIRNGHIVVSTDLLVEGRHFRQDWGEAEDVGHRVAAANLSDINAMGGRGHTLTLSLGVPSDLPVAWVDGFLRGLLDECALVGARLVGGDVTRAPQIVAGATAIGGCLQAPVTRSGARAGQVVAIAGRQGWAAGGLAVLGRGFRSPRALVDAYRRPEPPYDQGALAAQAGATAMIDVSDGLLADAAHIATASGVSIDVLTESFAIPEPLEAVAAAVGGEPIDFILGGGDDHALLATFDAAAVPEKWVVIGRVTEVDQDGAQVTVDGQPYEKAAGWSHF